MSTPNAALMPAGKAPAISNPANFPNLLGEIYEIREAFLRNLGAWNFLPVQRGGSAPASPSPYMIWIQAPAALAGGSISNPDAVMWDPTAGAWVAISPVLFGRAVFHYSGATGAIGSVVNNGNGSFTFNNGAGGSTTINMPVASVVNNGNGTYTFNNGIGGSVLIDTREGISADANNALTLGTDNRPYLSGSSGGWTVI